MAKINQINVGVVGVGWVGGIRATAVKKNPIVDKLYIAEIDEKRQQELQDELEPDIITDNWKDLVDDVLVRVLDVIRPRVLRDARHPTS